MSSSITTKEGMYVPIQRFGCILSWILSVIMTFTGCRTVSPIDIARIEPGNKRKFNLEHISNRQFTDFLCKLGLVKILPVSKNKAVLITQSPEYLDRVDVLYELVDVHENFVIENLGPATTVRDLPSNQQISTALCDIRIGTFAAPPKSDKKSRGIIDTQGDAVIAIIPVRYREQLLDLLQKHKEGRIIPTLAASHTTDHNEPYHIDYASEIHAKIELTEPNINKSTQEIVSSRARVISEDRKENLNDESIPQMPSDLGRASSVPDNKITSLDPKTQQRPSVDMPSPTDKDGIATQKTLKIIIDPFVSTTSKATKATIPESIKFENGEDILDLDLPETMTLTQLLELAGEYLNLDYVYDSDMISDQQFNLKLQGSLKGEMKIKDLYILLETVLKFNGLAMIRQKGKLTSIVPVDKVLEVDSRLFDVYDKAVEAGDTVTTRVFELQYVDVTSVMNLLQNMKLGVAVSSSEENQILFVTCYAHRMKRIEQLVDILDRPGRLRECRFRRLRHTAASVLIEKLRTIAQELQGAPITQASVGRSTSQQIQGLGKAQAVIYGQKVYIDTEERTNSILMIGFEEQLSILEKLIDVLDVPKKDLRITRTYNIKFLSAREALEKLQELKVLNPTALSVKSNPISDEIYDGLVIEEPLVVVLDNTNQLLIKATQEQHILISEFLNHIDVAHKELRILQVYEIKHVGANEIRKKLEELDIVRIGPVNIAGNKPGIQSTGLGVSRSLSSSVSSALEVQMEKPHLIVNEPTNSLLVTATTEQHVKVAEIINYLDRKLPEEDIPYRIYPLENSSPTHVADLLEKIIQGTTQDKEAKIEEVIKREEQITIVPDPNTFSLVVYASRKNQDWVAHLIKGLDKRRPQVLIDVTLVEISRTDTFEYDLNLVASAGNAVIDNIGIEPIHRIDRRSRLEAGFNLLDQEGSPTGETKAFYSDENVQMLLSAIQRKNYGRVLAKPKILVDDGHQGEISTSDETTYAKEAIQIPNQGPSITTRDFERIEATLKLQITPHISEGDLLRLDVNLSREDFGSRPTEDAPPDRATSQVTTTVFVPDNHTVILGGLVKLNQSKGGSKVPILGDIPLVGILFRSVENRDLEKKLYIFLKANVVRPYDEAQLIDLQKISEEHQKTFEKSEAEFQGYENIPGIKPKSMRPERVLVDQ